MRLLPHLATLALFFGIFTPVARYDYTCNPCDRNVGVWRTPGPEITGDYARPYLYDPCTEQGYSDPAFYEAQNALNRWKYVRPRRDLSVPPGRQVAPRPVQRSYRPAKGE